MTQLDGDGVPYLRSSPPATSLSHARPDGSFYVNSSTALYRGIVVPLVWLAIARAVPALGEQQPPSRSSDPATRQYAAAAGLHKQGVYDLAAEEWDRFLQRYPQHSQAPYARHFLGVCHLKLGNLPLAIDALTRVERTAPDFELLDSTLLNLGVARFNLARARDDDRQLLEQAAATFGRLVQRFPESKQLPRALFNRAECLYALGKLHEATAFYRQLIDDHPRHETAALAMYALAVSLQELKLFAQADDTLRRHQSQYPHSPLAAEIHLRRGECLMALDRYAEAEPEFSAAAAAVDFDDADFATLRQAECAVQRGDYDRAVAVYLRLTTAFPDSKYAMQARLGSGRAALLAGQYEIARASLRTVLEARGSLAAEAAHLTARCYLKEGRPADALRVVTTVTAQADGGRFEASLKMDRADALYAQPRRRQDAAAAYANLANEHPQAEVAAEALYMAALTSLELSQFDAAVAYATQFERKFPQNSYANDVRSLAAESHLQQGQYGPAEQQFHDLLARAPSSADAPKWRLRLAHVMRLNKKPREAIRLLAELTADLEKMTTADNELMAEAWDLVGRCQLDVEQTDEAIRGLETALTIMPDWPRADETILALADAYAQAGRFEDAKKRLQAFSERFGESEQLSRAYLQLAQRAVELKIPNHAVTAYQRAYDIQPEGEFAAPAMYGLGWTQLEQKRWKEAGQAFSTLIRRFPLSELIPQARYGRGIVYERQESFTEAAADLKAYLDWQTVASESYRARYLLGRCLAGLKRSREAADTFAELLAADPAHALADDVCYELAWTMKTLGRDDEAAKAFRRLAEVYGESTLAADGLFQLATLAYGDGSYGEAVNWYYRALEGADSPELGEKAAHGLAWCHYQQRKYGDARRWFTRQRRSYPQGQLVDEAAFMIAECFFQEGKFAEALTAYAEVRELADRKSAELAQLHAAQAAAGIERWDESLRLLEGFAESYPESPQLALAIYQRGWAKQNLNRLDEALADYEQVTVMTDGEVAAKARFMVGEVYFIRKEHREAIRHYFKVAYGYAYPQWQAAAHYEAGRCFEVLKMWEQAKSSYRQLVEKFPSSDKLPLAKKRLAAIEP